MTPRALLFDVDGTLADTEEVHRRAFNAAFRRHGLAFEWDRPLYKRLLQVAGGRARLEGWLAEFHPDLRDRAAKIHADKTALYEAMVREHGIPLRPGVRRLIEEAKAAGLRLGVATTTPRGNVAALIETAFRRPIGEVFDVVAGSEDAERKKPDPQVYRVALERLGVEPGRALAIEDSANGLAAARGAGLRCLITRCPWTADDDFTGAVAVVDDLGEVTLEAITKWMS